MADDRCEKTGGKTPRSLFPIRHQPSVISHFLAISFQDGLSLCRRRQTNRPPATELSVTGGRFHAKIGLTGQVSR